MGEDRLEKLAQKLDRLAAADELRVQRAQEIEVLRRQASGRLHQLCAAFVAGVNRHLRHNAIQLTPETFQEEEFRQGGLNLIQMNAAGRVIQLRYQGTEPLITKENWKTPYTLEGGIQWFNQEMLERDDVREHRIYFCLEGKTNGWRYFDQQSSKSGELDQEYLVSLFEKIL
ncbi:MAG: hypothetical protein FJW20_10455 [Acidimicrobiia bacterium]|nr:hypothetical protein [Acidimicrobiia bacterium]